jgi:hypothetical protein
VLDRAAHQKPLHALGDGGAQLLHLLDAWGGDGGEVARAVAHAVEAAHVEVYVER